MKIFKIFLVFLVCFISISSAFAARQYGCTGLTGGTAGMLDSLDITGATSPNSENLANGDTAFALVLSGAAGYWYRYVFDADGTDAESSPNIIRPDDYSTAGVWRLVSVASGMLPAASGSAAGAISAADYTKLSGIESNATADQTGAEIKVAYEAQSDTNAFTDAEKTKLAGIADGAQVDTDTTLSQEEVEDYAGAMVTGGTETGIDVTYDDTTGQFSFVVTGGSATVEDAAYDATWNGDTDGTSKNTIYDYLVNFDADSDGDFTDEAWFPSTSGAPTSATYLTTSDEAGLSAETVVSANGASLVTAVDYAAMRALLNLEAGTDVQAWSTHLDSLAADMAGNAGKITGSNLSDDSVGSAKMSVSANIKSLLDAATFQAIAELLESSSWDFTGDNTYGVVTGFQMKNSASDTYYGAFNIPVFTANRQIYYLDEDMRIPASDQTNSSGQVIFPVSIGVAISDETTDLTTGTAKLTFRAPYAFTLTEVRANVNTAPVGATLNIDINEGGVSVLSTVITIDASEETSETAVTPPVISDSSIADDAEITVDIDQIGSTTAGKGAKVWLIGTRTL